jgi:hypothetical protein
MKRILVLVLFFTSCSAPSVQNNVTSIAVLQDKNSNPSQNNGNSVVVQQHENFRVILPKSSWEQLFFESINERIRRSQLSNLRLKALPDNDLELRVWRGFGKSPLKGFVLKRTSGEWTAFDISWEAPRNLNDRTDVSTNDREEVWKKLTDAGILTLPDADEIKCSGNAFDGTSYVVEYNLGNSYRTYMYDNPDYAKCDEAKQMLTINKIIDEEFYKSEIKNN